MRNWRRKLLSSTLAVALLGGSLIGSIGSAVAADPLPASATTLISKLNSVYSYLTPAEKNDIDTARTAIRGIVAEGTATSISAPIWGRITDEKGAGYPNTTEASVLRFGLSFASINYDPTFTDLAEYRASNDFLNLMTDLKAMSGVTGTVDFADITSFYLSIEAATKSAVAALPTVTGVLDLVSFKNSMESKIQAIIDARATNIATIFYNLEVRAEDLMDAKTNLALNKSVVFDAEVALARAYQAMIVAANPVVSTPTTPTPTPTTPLPTLPEKASETAEEVLTDLAEKLADLPVVEKKAEVKKAEEAVEKAIKETAKATVPVVKTGDTARPTIDKTALLDKAKEAKVLADDLNKKLGESGGKKVEVEFTMNLGIVESDKVEVPFDKKFMSDMADEGIDSITAEVNGVEINVDSKEFNEDTTLSIEKKTKESAGDTSGKPIVSDYYNFEFSQNGDNDITFKKPVTITLPVSDTSNVDTDLLTLAKIINGKLEYYGGQYNSAGKYFQAQRNSFSTYVIVENKVEFNDITSVKSWAGRSIEVAAAKGIITGRGEGVYDPSANVTRAEFAKMLVTAFSLYDSTATESFDDVKDTDWYQSYVSVALAKGLVTGRTATSFDPNASITRQEMAVMVARALKLVLNEVEIADPDAALGAFTDADHIGDAYKASAALVVDQGIINGYAGKFDPKGITTRAQAAVVVKSLIDLQ